VAQNYYRTGSLWGSNWFCEQAEEAGLFPASRLIEGPGPSPRAAMENVAVPL